MNLADLAVNVLQHRQSTPDAVAEALRQAILLGIFKAGQSLRQDEIATQFGISRIPVREALRQLEAEGLVRLYPNRGATVSVLSAAEAQEICEIRIALETLALQLAIANLTEADIQRAIAILEATDQATDPRHWTELNWEFHATLYTSAHRPRLLTMIKTLHINVDRYIRLQMMQMNYQEQSQTEHWKLLEVCKQRDMNKAIDILKHHIATAAEQLVAHLR